MLLISYALRSCLRSPTQFHDTGVWNVPDARGRYQRLVAIATLPRGWLTGCEGPAGVSAARHRVRRDGDRFGFTVNPNRSLVPWQGPADAAYRQVNVPVAPAASVYTNARPRQATWNSIG